MKIHRDTIYYTILACLLSVAIACYFEYTRSACAHYGFWVNIFLGIFASSLLVLISSLIQYKVLKKKYLFKTLENCQRLFDEVNLFLVRITHYKSNDNCTLEDLNKAVSPLFHSSQVCVNTLNDIHFLIPFGSFEKQLELVRKEFCIIHVYSQGLTKVIDLEHYSKTGTAENTLIVLQKLIDCLDHDNRQILKKIKEIEKILIEKLRIPQEKIDDEQ